MERSRVDPRLWSCIPRLRTKEDKDPRRKSYSCVTTPCTTITGNYLGEDEFEELFQYKRFESKSAAASMWRMPSWRAFSAITEVAGRPGACDGFARARSRSALKISQHPIQHDVR